MPGVAFPISYTSTAGGFAGGVFLWLGVLWLGLPLWAVSVLLQCLSVGSHDRRLAFDRFRAFLFVICLCVLWIGSAVSGWRRTLRGTPPEGDRHRHYKAEGVLRVAEKYKRLSIFTRYSAIVVPLVPFNKSL